MSADGWESTATLRAPRGTVTFARGVKGAEAGTRAASSRRGPRLGKPEDSTTAPRQAEESRKPALAPRPTVGEGAGTPEYRGHRREEEGEVERQREAGRAGPAQERGGATHLCSRPAESEWPGSLVVPTPRSGHAPTRPPSSRLLLQLQLLRHHRAQPGNHDGRAVRALHHLPPFSPPPPAFPPQTTVAAVGGNARAERTFGRPRRRAPVREAGRRRAPRVRRVWSGKVS